MPWPSWEQAATASIVLIVATLALAWLFANMVFTLHYAHLYYLQKGGRDRGGIQVPGVKEPDYWDFLYFAFTLGMTFQTSDVTISDAHVRRVVLGVQQEGRAVARARSTVTQHLLHMGESVLAPALSSDDLLCTSTDCLQRLARSFRADRLVGGEILPNDRNYIVRTWMLDLQTAQPSTTEDRCTECSAEQASEVIARAAGKLIDANLAPAATPAPAPPAPTPAAPAPSTPAQVELTMPPPPPAVPGSSGGDGLTASGSAATAAPPHASCRPRFYSFGRGIAVGALSALALGSLVSGIGLLAADGSVYIPAGEQGFPGDVTHNFKPEYRAAFAAAALSAVGLGAAVTPWQRWVGHTDASANNLPLCPLPRGKWTFQRGAAIGALGSLLAGSLVTSFVLTGLNGQSYVSDDPSVISMEVPYHYQIGRASCRERVSSPV